MHIRVLPVPLQPLCDSLIWLDYVAPMHCGQRGSSSKEPMVPASLLLGLFPGSSTGRYGAVRPPPLTRTRRCLMRISPPLGQWDATLLLMLQVLSQWLLLLELLLPVLLLLL